MKQLSIRKKFAKRGNTLLHIDAGFPLAPNVQVTNLSCIPAHQFTKRSSNESEDLIRISRPRPKATQHKLSGRAAALLRLKRLNEHSMLGLGHLMDRSSQPHKPLLPSSVRKDVGVTLCVEPQKRPSGCRNHNLRLNQSLVPTTEMGVQALSTLQRPGSRYKKIVSNALYSREYHQHRLKALELSELQKRLNRPKQPAITITKLVHDKQHRLHRYRPGQMPELSLPQISQRNVPTINTSQTPTQKRSVLYRRSRQLTQELNGPKSYTGEALYGGCELPPLTTVCNDANSQQLSNKIKVTIELHSPVHVSTRAPHNNPFCLERWEHVGESNESVDEFHPLY